MKQFTNKIKILTVMTFIGFLGISSQVFATDTNKVVTPSTVKLQAKTPANTQYITLKSPIMLVDNPAQYLNKHVEFTAKFNKFSNLGLDYPPTSRGSQVYTGFLIERDDVTTHVIPLSELKMFIKISDLKQYSDLTSGDKIKIKGKVFSAALGDPWLDIEGITILEHPKSESKN